MIKFLSVTIDGTIRDSERECYYDYKTVVCEAGNILTHSFLPETHKIKS